MNKKLESELRMHASDLLAFSYDYDVPIGRMFSSIVEFDDDEDDCANEDANQSIGFVRCAALVIGKSPAKLVRQYGRVDKGEDHDAIIIPFPRARR